VPLLQFGNNLKQLSARFRDVINSPNMPSNKVRKLVFKLFPAWGRYCFIELAVVFETETLSGWIQKQQIATIINFGDENTHRLSFRNEYK